MESDIRVENSGNIKKILNQKIQPNSLVSHSILTNHTFDFYNSTIFAFIHDRDKRRIIKACALTNYDTITQRQGFYKISPFLAKKVLKDFNIYLYH